VAVEVLPALVVGTASARTRILDDIQPCALALSVSVNSTRSRLQSGTLDMARDPAEREYARPLDPLDRPWTVP